MFSKFFGKKDRSQEVAMQVTEHSMVPSSSSSFISLLLVSLALVASCTDGALASEANPIGVVPDAGPDVPPADAADGPDGVADAGVALAIPGRFARSADRLADGTWAVLTDKPKALSDPTGLDPDRALAWIGPDGRIQSVALAPAGRALLDVAVHPSGEVTVLHGSAEGFFLGRYGLDRAPGAYFHLVDLAIATDPPSLRPGESKSPIEEHTHDVGRIAADGEGIVLATRTGRHSVLAYRIGFDRATAQYAVRSRTLVVPAHPIAPVGLNGGTYDTFGQLDAHYAVHVVRGTSGVAWVAVSHARLESGAMVRAHKEVFGESLVTDPDWLDLFVSRIASDGVRLGTSVVSTPNDDQLFGLRAIGDDAYAVGRTEHWNEHGTGFEALVAKIDARGLATIRELAVDQGDIAFDVAPAPDTGIVVVGASGYSQNPHGASVSESSSPFVRWLRFDGSVTLIDVPSGPRHNEARFVFPADRPERGIGRYWIGGMHDGPGTHSADGEPSRLRADGFITAVLLGP